MTLFTPGPWYIKRELRYAVNAKTRHIAMVSDYWQFKQDEEINIANATLIAAAPDMFKALNNVLKDMDKIDEVCKMAGVHEFTLMRQEIEAAIKLAKGDEK